jgi:hypothetical protein
VFTISLTKSKAVTFMEAEAPVLGVYDLPEETEGRDLYRGVYDFADETEGRDLYLGVYDLPEETEGRDLYGRRSYRSRQPGKTPRIRIDRKANKNLHFQLVYAFSVFSKGGLTKNNAFSTHGYSLAGFCKGQTSSTRRTTDLGNRGICRSISSPRRLNYNPPQFRSWATANTATPQPRTISAPAQ